MYELVAPTPVHQTLYEEMMDEWEAFGGRLQPGALRRSGASYAQWLRWMEQDRHADTCPEGSVPQDLLFLIRRDGAGDALLGAVTIRRPIPGGATPRDGAFGLGIRPGERGKGHGKRLLRMAMEMAARDYGMTALCLTCDADNLESARMIEACGGVPQARYTREDGTEALQFTIAAIHSSPPDRA